MKILVIAAHPDDIEFSMGGTLARLATEDHEIMVQVFSDSSTIPGNDGIFDEVRESIGHVYELPLILRKFATMHFMEHYQEIRDIIYGIKTEFKPDVVYCKSPNAIHPDHRVIGEACESIFLECSVIAMEGIRDGHNQMINMWNVLDQAELDVKMTAIGCYKSQKKRHYSDLKVVEALARMRGNQCGAEFAEGFEIIRLISR